MAVAEGAIHSLEAPKQFWNVLGKCSGALTDSSGVLPENDIAAGMITAAAEQLSNLISFLNYHHHQNQQRNMASNYTQPPPAYPSTNKLAAVPPEEEATQPLLHPQAGPSAGFGGYYDQPLVGDVPDDFKVNIGTIRGAHVPDTMLCSMARRSPTALWRLGMHSCARSIPSYVSIVPSRSKS